MIFVPNRFRTPKYSKCAWLEVIMPSGGRRLGSGRKPSAVRRAAEQKIRLRSRELLDRAAQEGIMPITVMLESMRHLWSEARRDGKPDTEKMMAACSVAAQCAPYVHPRLSSFCRPRSRMSAG